MLAYTTIGTSDMDRAVAFYDELLACERIPGVFYRAYVRDLDGNKLCFMEMKFG